MPVPEAFDFIPVLWHVRGPKPTSAEVRRKHSILFRTCYMLLLQLSLSMSPAESKTRLPDKLTRWYHLPLALSLTLLKYHEIRGHEAPYNLFPRRVDTIEDVNVFLEKCRMNLTVLNGVTFFRQRDSDGYICYRRWTHWPSHYGCHPVSSSLM